MGIPIIEYFANEFAERDDDWFPCEIVPPWRHDAQWEAPRCRLTPHGLHLQGYVEGGADGTIALRVPPSMRPDEDQPEIVETYPEGGRLYAKRSQLLAGGYVRLWYPIDIGPWHMSEQPSLRPQIVQYEADSHGRVYAEYDNGAVLPTGWVIPTLKGMSKIAPATFEAHTKASYGA